MVSSAAGAPYVASAGKGVHFSALDFLGRAFHCSRRTGVLMADRARKAFRLDAIGQAGLGLSLGAAAEYFGVLATWYGAGVYLLALISSAPFLTNLFAPMWSQQSKRYGVQKLVVASLVGSGIVLVLMYRVTKPSTFAFMAVLFYLFFGATDPLYVILADEAYSGQSSRFVGKAESIFSLVHAIGATIVGKFTDLVGTALGMLGGAVGSWLAALAYGLFPSTARHECGNGGEADSSPWNLFRRNHSMRSLVLAFMVPATGMVLMLPAMPIVEVRLAGLTNTRIGYLFGTNSLTWFASAYMWGKVLEKRETLWAFQIAMLSMAAMALLYGFLHTFAALLAANVFCAFGGSAISVGWRVQAMRLEGVSAEDVAGLHLFTCGLRGLVVPVVAARIIDSFGVGVNCAVSAGLLLAGVVLFDNYAIRFHLRGDSVPLLAAERSSGRDPAEETADPAD